MTAFRTQCPPIKVMLCIAPSSVWLAVILQTISWRTSLSEGTLSLPPQRGKLLWIVTKKLCYSGMDCDTELNSTAATDKEKTCELSDGNIITVCAERFHCAEVSFHPSFTVQKASDFHDTSFQSNMKCDVYIRKDLYANVVSSGSVATFQQIVACQNAFHDGETTASAPFTLKLMVVSPPESMWSVSIGRSILSSPTRPVEFVFSVVCPWHDMHSRSWHQMQNLLMQQSIQQARRSVGVGCVT